MGPCPVYEVEVFGDGSVRWNGEHFVAREGRHRWETTRRRLTAMVKAIERVDFFNLRTSSEMRVTDHASAIITVEFKDGRCHTIDYSAVDVPLEAVDVPLDLPNLDEVIDRLAGTAPYVKGEPGELIPGW